jgi:hypothetical protein
VKISHTKILALGLILSGEAQAIGVPELWNNLQMFAVSLGDDAIAPDHHRLHLASPIDDANELFITQNTLEHSSQHYPSENIVDLESASRWAREDRGTSVLDGDGEFERALETMMKDGIVYALDKKGQALIDSDADTIAYQSPVQLDTEAPTTFLIVFCRHESCDDDARGVIRKDVFKRNEVLSIYPVCGPRVKMIEKGSVLKKVNKDSPLKRFLKSSACKR